MAYPHGLVRTRQGDIIVVPQTSSDRILRYPVGTTEPLQIGKAGSGPGEYLGIRDIVYARDSLFVFDRINQKVEVLDAQFRYIESIRLPGMINTATPISPDLFALNADFGTSSTVGYPLHILNRQGQLVASFGEQAAGFYRADYPEILERNLSPGAAGTFWSGRVTEYVIEQWDSYGNRIRSLARDVPWFPSSSFISWLDPQIRFPGAGRAIKSQGDTLVWTATWISDDDWQDTFERQSGQAEPVFNQNLQDYYDTIIEVIDVVAREVVAQVRLDAAVIQFLDDGLIATYRGLENGTVLLDFYRLTLKW